VKYILTGSLAVRNYIEGDYKEVANLITHNEADIYGISSLDEIHELIEQLKGWDDFCVITDQERKEILKKLNK
jgi:3-dehydroquinate dehydratase